MSVDAPIELDASGIQHRVPREMDPENTGLTYGARIGYVLRWIDQVCDRFGWTPLRAFVVPFDVADRASDSRAFWSDPLEALPVVESLKRHVENLDDVEWIQNPDSGWRIDRDDVLWDLEAYRLILEHAAATHQRFRILLG